MQRKLPALLLMCAAIAAVGCARKGPPAKVREKRVVPVDSGARQSFDRQPKIAVLAGVGHYPSRSGLSQLRYPSRDVELLQQVLNQQNYKVVALKDQEATGGSIEQALKDAAELADQRQGTVLFFFSGHGFADRGENYLATFEATSDRLAATGLAVKTVEALLKATGAPRQVMFLDACRDEPGKTAGTRSFERFRAAAGLRELLSTKAGRISYEDDQLGSGVFTHFLVRGLGGEAAGLDGLITFRDLADYVTDGVSNFGFQHGQMQVPYESGESSGDFLLARTIVAAPPPAPSASAKAPFRTHADMNPRNLYYQAAGHKDTLPSISEAAARHELSRRSAGAMQAGAVHLGLRYNLALVNMQSGSSENIDPERFLHQGECFALDFEANRSGYLYVLARQSSGSWQALLPSPVMADESNIIDPEINVRVPAHHCFQVQDPPGTETLFVLLSRDPSDVYALYEGLKRQSDQPAPDLPRAANPIDNAVSQLTQEFGYRDIAILKLAQPASPREAPHSVYVVNTSEKPSSSVVTQIEIHHR